MGEAKRRRAAGEGHQAWLDQLAPTEHAIATTALRLHSNFVVRHHFMGGCYLLAFFLRQYLKRALGIEARAVVGYACDGTTPLRMSHAWLEYEGKKTDVSLTITEFPEHQIPGQLLVLDRIIRPGRAAYTYHLEDSPESLAKKAESSAYSPRFAALNEMKVQEHADMSARAADDDVMWRFMETAPPHLRYAAMVTVMDRS